MAKKELIIGKVTAELVEAAKKEHNEVYIIEVSETRTGIDLSEEHQKAIETIETLYLDPAAKYAILSKPGKRELGVAMTMKDPIQMGNFIMKNCGIIADTEIFEDDDTNITAALQTFGFIQLKEGSLKKY